MTDQVIALRDGFYASVNGKLYGPWPMREYALAGLQVEQRRANPFKSPEPYSLEPHADSFYEATYGPDLITNCCGVMATKGGVLCESTCPACGQEVYEEAA